MPNKTLRYEPTNNSPEEYSSIILLGAGCVCFILGVASIVLSTVASSRDTEFAMLFMIPFLLFFASFALLIYGFRRDESNDLDFSFITREGQVYFVPISLWAGVAVWIIREMLTGNPVDIFQGIAMLITVLVGIVLLIIIARSKIKRALRKPFGFLSRFFCSIGEFIDAFTGIFKEIQRIPIFGQIVYCLLALTVGIPVVILGFIIMVGSVGIVASLCFYAMYLGIVYMCGFYISLVTHALSLFVFLIVGKIIPFPTIRTLKRIVPDHAAIIAFAVATSFFLAITGPHAVEWIISEYKKGPGQVIIYK